MPALPSTSDAILRRLEWTVIRRLDGLLVGNYRSLFRGFGVDLADLREYAWQDDVRHIDWNVSARLDTPHVRVFNEEREVTAWFLLDLSPSLAFGSQIAKADIAVELVAVLARLLSRHGNRVGAMLYGSRVEAVIPPGSGRGQVLQLLERMRHRPPPHAAQPTRLQELLRAALSVVRRRSLVFVVSDFISEPGWERELARLAMRHEVVAIRLYDALESALPDLGLLVVQDSETGEQLFVDTHDRAFRSRFAAAAARREEALRDAFADAGVDALELATDDDVLQAILRFADLRKRRAQLSSGGVLRAHLEKT